MKKVKKRESNIELLRIVAMFFVLIGHVLLIGGSDYPDMENMCQYPIKSISRYLLSTVSCVGVDVFVLISGWFGIKFSMRGLTKFLFQFLFLTFFIIIFAFVYDRYSFDITSLKASLGLYKGYWFVMAYMGLYLLSPILNAFVEKCTESQLRILLFMLYLFQCYYSWITGFVDYFEGYSITFFCLLYLTARYVRLYPIRCIYRHAHWIYMGGVFIQTLIFVYAWTHYGFAARMIRYDNPLVILQGLVLLIAVSKVSFHNKVINWISLSSFAVYIIHFHPLVFDYFRRAVLIINETYSEFTYVSIIILFLISVFITCILIDKVRILAWNNICLLFR